MADQRVIDTVRLYLTTVPKELGLKRAYLFGSHAKGSAHPDSDIDVALVLSNMSDYFSAQALLFRLRRNIDLRIEPHPFRREEFNSSDPFAHEIIRTGIEVVAET